MRIREFTADPSWVLSLDLAESARNARDDTVQFVKVSLPDLRWDVYHLLAPRGHGFWWLRDDYTPFASSTRRVFNVSADGSIDEPSRNRFDETLRKLGIAANSLHARLSFGIYSRLWGDRYGPKRIDARVFGRYVAVASPVDASERVRAYLLKQLDEFGGQAVRAVDENAKLFYTGDIPEYQRLILLAPPATLDFETAAKVENMLRELLSATSAVSEFARTLDPRVVFAGASMIAGPVLSPTEHGRSTEARIAELRIRLLLALGWPHALDMARRHLSAACRSSAMPECPAFIATLDEGLSRFRVVHEDPLSDAQQWRA